MFRGSRWIMDKILEELKNPWIIVGFTGQIVFMMRFVVQWIASERKKASVIPLAFWYLSMAGAALLLTYSIAKHDPVFILAQSFGFIVYARNLVLIRRSKGAEGKP